MASQIGAQKLHLSPDIVLGNRSFTYKHFAKYSINGKFSMDNLTLFDTEHESDSNNIYFIRNNLSYQLFGKWSLNLGMGIKNPGSFYTFSIGFRTRKQSFKIGYNVGSTYQNGFSIEQTLTITFEPILSPNLKGFINLLAVGNLNSDGYIRGLQQFKVGVQKTKLVTGLALNLDQFNNSRKKLENMGFFLMYNL
jgi:hypothetical protein